MISSYHCSVIYSTDLWFSSNTNHVFVIINMSPSNLENNPGILCSEGCFPVYQLLCEQCLCNTKPNFARWGSTPIPLNISCGDGCALLRNIKEPIIAIGSVDSQNMRLRGPIISYHLHSDALRFIFFFLLRAEYAMKCAVLHLGAW